MMPAKDPARRVLPETRRHLLQSLRPCLVVAAGVGALVKLIVVVVAPVVENPQ